MNYLYWGIGIGIIVVILYLLDREIYFYEATHLGPRIQGWLYDRWAANYDLGKAESITRDAEMLAKPVLEAIKDKSHVLMMDLATGTGRFPLAIARETGFKGHIIAVDVSTGMLEQAVQKLSDFRSNVSFLRVIDFPLPFADNTFDVVSCMEALEVMPEMETPLSELYRILRPGGLLVTSRATDASGRKSKIKSVSEFKSILEEKGFEQVQIVEWWRWFDRVIAHKAGSFAPPADRSLAAVLQCPGCGEARLEETEGGKIRCKSCGYRVKKDENGIVLL